MFGVKGSREPVRKAMCFYIVSRHEVRLEARAWRFFMSQCTSDSVMFLDIACCVGHVALSETLGSSHLELWKLHLGLTSFATFCRLSHPAGPLLTSLFASLCGAVFLAGGLMKTDAPCVP